MESLSLREGEHCLSTSLHAPKAVLWEVDPWPVLLIRNEGDYLGRVGYREIYKCRVGKSPGGILLSALLSPPRPTQNERRNPSAVNSLVGSTNKKGLKFHASFHLPAPIRDLQCDNTTPLRTPTEALLGDACTRKEGCEKSQKMENSKSINVCNIKTGFRRKDTQENISDLLKRKLVLNISKAHITLAIISACITPKPGMPPSIFYKDPLASRESTCFDVHSGN